MCVRKTKGKQQHHHLACFVLTIKEVKIVIVKHYALPPIGPLFLLAPPRNLIYFLVKK